MHKGDRKNLRDQGWAGNLRYLRNLRGRKRLTQIPLNTGALTSSKGDRKNLRNQGWAGNLRYLRNLRGGKRLTQISLISQINVIPTIPQISLNTGALTSSKSDRKNLRNQGWAGNPRNLRNLRGT
jgi:DNA-binding NtrC family response regulator